MAKVTPMIQQYLLTKEAYPDSILLYRLGDFYEMFFEDAITASRELEIVLTGRDCGMGERAPMCGVPYHSVDTYIKRLLEKGYKVAICEQMTDPALSKGLVEREVIRVITPGTAVLDNMMDPQRNLYLLCLCVQRKRLGVSYCDVSTGELFTDSVECTYIQKDIAALISTVAPAEILVSREMLETYQTVLSAERIPLSTTEDRAFTQKAASDTLYRHFGVSTLAGFGLPDKGEQVIAAGALVHYLHQTQKNDLSHIRTIRQRRDRQLMELDITTRRNLELLVPMMGGSRRHTLLGTMDYTKTAQGSRLLRNYLEHPLQQQREIEQRLDAVEDFTSHYALRLSVGEALETVYDLERLCSKLSYGTLNARDALAIANTLRQLPTLRGHLSPLRSELIQTVCARLPELSDLAEAIEAAIDENAPLALKDGGFIKTGYNAEVDELRLAATKGREWMLALEAREKEATGIRTLKVGYNRVFGFYLEVSKAQSDQVPYRYVRRQTLANAERYITEELKELEETILGADEKCIRLEQELFLALRERIAQRIDELQLASQLIAQVDVLLCFATAAYENNYVKPTLNQEGILRIKEGRHPVVERSVEGFVPNDVLLNRDDNRFHLITGPNMSGKSTFMRQVAMIVLMAHMGSFVPASEADLCVVDRIFTRVGASDNLASGRSTFMVEMVELANILNHATEKSLIILDEIGRGTSTYDGLSIAWAAVEYICAHFEGAKTLFATHYHELSDLEGRIDGVRNYCVLARETQSEVIFLHRVIRGGTDKSFGVQVAALAGVPKEVIVRANELLDQLQNSEHPKARKPKGDDQLMFSVTDPKQVELVHEIAAVDIGKVTPLEALNLLNLFINQAKGAL